MTDEDLESEVDEVLPTLCTGCGCTIRDEEDMVVVSAMRRQHGDVTSWHVFLCVGCEWRAEYSAHLKWVIERA